MLEPLRRRPGCDIVWQVLQTHLSLCRREICLATASQLLPGPSGFRGYYINKILTIKFVGMI